MRRSARLWISCCASVLATTNSTPCRFAASMLSTALVPPPPTPMTVIRGLKSVCGVCGMVRFSVIATSPPVVAIRLRRCYATCLDSRCASHALLQKIDDAADHPLRALYFQVDIVHRTSLARRPRQHPRGGREGGTRRRIGQATQHGRAAKTHLLVEDAPGQ